MKRISLLVVIIISTLVKLTAQTSVCNPNSPCDSICPDPQQYLYAEPNKPYQQTITFNFDTTGVLAKAGFGYSITIDSVKINSVTGLPAGINWYTECGMAKSCKGNLLGLSCMNFSGTPTTIGTYIIIINRLTYLSAFGTTTKDDTLRLKVTETPLRFSIQSSNVSAFSLCDGKAKISMSGGAAPYSYQWNSGETTDSITAKCSDKYTLIATDANNIVDSVDIYISEPYDPINNVPPSTPPAPDTIITNLDTCIINYDFPIDSMFIGSYTVIDSTHATIDFEIYQQGQKITFSADFEYDSTGTNLVVLQLNCKGTFTRMLKSTVYQEQINIQYSDIGIKKIVKTSGATSIGGNILVSESIAEVYPNPFSNELSIGLKSNSLVSISDVKGNLVYKARLEKGITIIDLKELDRGVYFIDVLNDSQKITKKVVKY